MTLPSKLGFSIYFNSLEIANSTHSFTAGLVCSLYVEHTVDITTFKSTFIFKFLMFILIKTRKDYHRKTIVHLRELFE